MTRSVIILGSRRYQQSSKPDVCSRVEGCNLPPKIERSILVCAFQSNQECFQLDKLFTYEYFKSKLCMLHCY